MFVSRHYPLGMPDTPHLRPATAAEIADALSFALRYHGRKRVNHADDMMARITADRLVQHLADSDEGGHLFQSDRGHHSNLMAASLASSRGPVLVMSRRRSRGQAVAHGSDQNRSRFAEQS
jgi:hypothetical protein